MTSVIKTKDQEQRKALNAWAKAGFTGSIIAGTGFGKSRCGVLAVAHSIDEHDSKGNALIIVPTQRGHVRAHRSSVLSISLQVD